MTEPLPSVEAHRLSLFAEEESFVVSESAVCVSEEDLPPRPLSPSESVPLQEDECPSQMLDSQHCCGLEASVAETTFRVSASQEACEEAALVSEGLFVAETVARVLAETLADHSAVLSGGEKQELHFDPSATPMSPVDEVETRASCVDALTFSSTRRDEETSSKARGTFPATSTRSKLGFRQRRLSVQTPSARATRITACAAAEATVAFGFDSGELILSAYSARNYSPRGPAFDSEEKNTDFAVSPFASTVTWARRLRGCGNSSKEEAGIGEEESSDSASAEARIFLLQGHRAAISDVWIEGGVVVSSSAGGSALVHLSPFSDSSLKPQSASFSSISSLSLPEGRNAFQIVAPILSLSFSSPLRCVCLSPAFRQSRLLSDWHAKTVQVGGVEMKEPQSRLSLASAAGVQPAVCVGCEDGRLVLHFRGLFTERNATLHSGEGPVLSVRWRGSLLCWSTAEGVRIYDFNSQQKVAFVSRPQAAPTAAKTGDRGGASEGFLVWLSDSLLAVGWQSSLQLVAIEEHAVRGAFDAEPSLESEEALVSLRLGRLLAVVDTAPEILCGVSKAGADFVDQKENQPAVCILTSQPSVSRGEEFHSEGKETLALKVSVHAAPSSSSASSLLFSQVLETPQREEVGTDIDAFCFAALENSGILLCRSQSAFQVQPWEEAEWATQFLHSYEELLGEEENALLEAALKKLQSSDASFSPQIFDLKVELILLLLRRGRAEAAVGLLLSLRLRTREAWLVAVDLFDEWNFLSSLATRLAQSQVVGEEAEAPPPIAVDGLDDFVKLDILKRLLEHACDALREADSTEPSSAEGGSREDSRLEKKIQSRRSSKAEGSLSLDSAVALGRCMECDNFLSDESRRELARLFLNSLAGTDADPNCVVEVAVLASERVKESHEREQRNAVRRVLLTAATRLVHSQRLYTWAAKCLLKLGFPSVASYIRAVLQSACNCPRDAFLAINEDLLIKAPRAEATCRQCGEEKSASQQLAAEKEASVKALMASVPRLAGELLARDAEGALALLCMRVASNPPWLRDPLALDCFCLVSIDSRCAVCSGGNTKSRSALVFPAERIAVELERQKLRLLLLEYLKAARVACPVSTQSLALLQVELFRSLEPQGLLSFLHLAEGTYDCGAVLALLEKTEQSPPLEMPAKTGGLEDEEERQRRILLSRHAASRLLQPNRVKAFLLERLNRREEALHLLVERCHDVEAAVRLVENAMEKEGTAETAEGEEEGFLRRGDEDSRQGAGETSSYRVESYSSETLWRCLVELCLKKASLTTALLRALDKAVSAKCCTTGRALGASEERDLILGNTSLVFVDSVDSVFSHRRQSVPTRWSLLPLSLAQELLQMLPTPKLKKLLPAVERRVASLVNFQRSMERLYQAASLCAEAEAQEIRCEIFQRRRQAVALELGNLKDATCSTPLCSKTGGESSLLKSSIGGGSLTSAWASPLGLPRWMTAIPSTEGNFARRSDGTDERQTQRGETERKARAVRRSYISGLRRRGVCVVCQGALASLPNAALMWRSCEENRFPQTQNDSQGKKDAEASEAGLSVSDRSASARTQNQELPNAAASAAECSAWEGASSSVEAFSQTTEEVRKLAVSSDREATTNLSILKEGSVVVLWCGHCMHFQCCQRSLINPAKNAEKSASLEGRENDSPSLPRWLTPTEELELVDRDWRPRCVLCCAAISSGWRGEWGGFCASADRDASTRRDVST